MVTTAERVAALYLMYAMYFKQPTNNFCKFRFTQSDWNKMKQFYDTIGTDAKYLQARSIFWRLWQCNAFRFVECDREHYPETMQFHRLENDGLDNFQKINASILGHVNELQNDSKGLLSAIGTLQMGYNEMKEHFAATQRECKELQTIDVINDINSHLLQIRKLFESKFDANKKSRRPNTKAKVINRILAGPSKLMVEQDSDVDGDLNESNDESTTYSGKDYDDYAGDDGDDDDSNIDDDENTETECLNIGTKRYYLKRKAEQNEAGEMHTLRSSVFPSQNTTPTKTKKTHESIANWPADYSSTVLQPSVEHLPLSIDDVDGKIVISQPKKVYNRHSKKYRSSVRKQFIDCPK